MTIQNKIVLNAGTIPHVALDFMNNTHFEEIELVEKLGELISDYEQSDAPSQTETKRLSEMLDKWLHHTQAHFLRENELMQQINFPMISVHSMEHESTLENMTNIVREWQSDFDTQALAEYVFTSWPAWFDNHVNSMDMITAHFAVMQGFDPHASA